MTNENLQISNTVSARESIDISKKQSVRPSGDKITAPTWNAGAGLARQVEIQAARDAALAEHRKTVEDATTVGQRLTNLENEFVTIRQDLDKILKLLGANNVKA